MTISEKTTPIKTTPQQGWQAAYDLELPTVLWRLPRQQEKHFLVNFSNHIPAIKPTLDQLEAGFLISPFLNLDGDQTLFIKADLYFKFTHNNEILSESIAATIDSTNFNKWINNCKSANYSNYTYSGFINNSTINPLEKEQYLASVRQAVEAIEMGKMQKVVLSRSRQIEFSETVFIPALFDRLCNKYPNAFVSLIYLPHLQQVWIGATPEVLVSIDKEGIFRTISLAGTQSAVDTDGNAISPKYASWTQKEIEEQAFVSRYIIECFKKIRVREFIEEGPKTVIAGNLMHLRTDYSIDTKAINFPELGNVMLELLHPTSAVCGMPKFAALQFIQDHETHNREFYSGYLGPVNVGEETHLFVNLRCMKIEGDKATLYAGGGITEDSIAEKEWQETELKMQTLLGAIG